MSRIKTTFDALQARGRKALIPYVTCGDPFAAALVCDRDREIFVVRIQPYHQAPFNPQLQLAKTNSNKHVSSVESAHK